MTNKNRLTYNEAVELLQRAVQEKGADFKFPAYGSCTYFAGDNLDQPNCIVGHVLAYKEITHDDIEDLSGYEHANDRAITDLGPQVFPRLAKKTQRLLAETQLRQDGGYTWGEALEYGIQEARRVR